MFNYKFFNYPTIYSIYLENTVYVFYLNSRLKHLVKTWQGLQDREIMIGSSTDVLIKRAKRPISINPAKH